MALKKIQDLIEKLSQNPNVQKVISDVQSATHDIQNKINNMDTDAAVKKYKELVKKASSKESQLHKEVQGVISKIKKSAVEVEKNLKKYKNKAQTERAKLEKILKAKAAKATPKKAAKKATTKKAAAKKKSASKK